MYMIFAQKIFKKLLNREEKKKNYTVKKRKKEMKKPLKIIKKNYNFGSVRICSHSMVALYAQVKTNGGGVSKLVTKVIIVSTIK